MPCADEGAAASPHTLVTGPFEVGYRANNPIIYHTYA